MIRVLRAADRVAVPWKNGGGITREVAAWPPGSGFDDFLWRVSIAEVREAGPFSLFPNIDRTLMVLDGRIRLTFAGRAVDLTADSAPFSFPGDVACEGTPLGGPVTDLNVMTRRKKMGTTARRGNGAVSTGTTHALVVALTSFDVENGHDRVRLEPRDAIFIEGDAERLSVGGDAYVIEFVTARAKR